MAQRPIADRAQRTHPLVVPLSILLVPLIAYFDHATGPELGFSLFYLVPVVVVARFGSRASGWLTAIVAALAWMVVDVLTTPEYTGVLVPLWNTLTRFAFYTFALIAVRRGREELRTARIEALSDPLTGLPNRQFLGIMLDAARARLERYGSPLTLAYLDVDGFKQVNDLHGHVDGDKLLQRIGTVLLDEVRDTDTVARIGGDEFLILLPDADSDSVRQILERVHRSLCEIPMPEGSKVGFSIGASVFHRPLESSEAMVREADEVMYDVKRSGTGGIRVTEVGRV